MRLFKFKHKCRHIQIFVEDNSYYVYSILQLNINPIFQMKLHCLKIRKWFKYIGFYTFFKNGLKIHIIVYY